MRRHILIILIASVAASCAKPAPVPAEPLVAERPKPTSPLDHCCVEAGGSFEEVGCPGAETATFADCVDRVATLEPICADDIETSGCKSCPEFMGGAGPLVLDDSADVVVEDDSVRVARVSGCSEAPQSVVLHRKGSTAWTRVGEPLAGTCRPSGDAFMCSVGAQNGLLEVDAEKNTVAVTTVGILGRGIGLGNLGTGLTATGSTGKPVPKIVPGRAIVQGSLDKEIVRRVVRQHRREFKWCYEEHLKTVPKYSGRITVKFVIAASGAVQRADVTDSKPAAPSMEQCMVDKVSKWVFPQPKRGGIVIVHYPFNFTY